MEDLNSISMGVIFIDDPGSKNLIEQQYQSKWEEVIPNESPFYRGYIKATYEGTIKS